MHGIALTDDKFLGGRLTVKQPAKGFRSGADTVLLAAAVSALPGQSVLELGLGAGVASLCLGARVPGLRLTGLEVQRSYAALARENARANGIELEVIEGDVSAMPPALTAQTFDHVFANPPYFRPGGGTAPRSPDRAAARGESAPLAVWLDAATRRLAPGGWLTLIQKAARVADLIATLDSRLGSLAIKPVAARPGRPAELVILRARKGGRADPKLYPPLVLHRGAHHPKGARDSSEAAEMILRLGEKLEF